MAATNAPKPVRRRRNKPVRGDYTPAPGAGWQHGTTPEPPDGLKPESVTAWATWMASWVAAHWSPDDLPGLRVMILTYDQLIRGEYQRGPELRLLMDTYGITPKGQQDRRWIPPKAEEKPEAEGPTTERYGHLRSVG